MNRRFERLRITILVLLALAFGAAVSRADEVRSLEIDGAQLSESQVICEWLEDAYPRKPLYPRDPLERARVRELITILELHIELVARRLYGQVFFKRPPMSGERRRSPG